MEQQQLPDHPLPEDYMKDIPQFLIQPKGSNFVIDDTQPVFNLDDWYGQNAWYYYSRVHGFYGYYYVKSRRREQAEKRRDITYKIIIVVISIGLLIGLILIAEGLGLAVGISPLLILPLLLLIVVVGSVFGLLLTPIDNYCRRRRQKQYEKRMTQLREESNLTELHIIYYFEELHKWIIEWKSNHKDEDLGTAFNKRIKELRVNNN